MDWKRLRKGQRKLLACSSIQRISAEAKKIESGQIVSFETIDKKKTIKKQVLEEFDKCVVMSFISWRKGSLQLIFRDIYWQN